MDNACRACLKACHICMAGARGRFRYSCGSRGSWSCFISGFSGFCSNKTKAYMMDPQNESVHTSRTTDTLRKTQLPLPSARSNLLPSFFLRLLQQRRSRCESAAPALTLLSATQHLPAPGHDAAQQNSCFRTPQLHPTQVRRHFWAQRAQVQRHSHCKSLGEKIACFSDTACFSHSPSFQSKKSADIAASMPVTTYTRKRMIASPVVELARRRDAHARQVRYTPPEICG